MPIVAATLPTQATITQYCSLAHSNPQGQGRHRSIGTQSLGSDAVRASAADGNALRVVPDRVDVDWLGQAGQRAATCDKLPLDACRPPQSWMGRGAGRRMLHGAEWVVLYAPGFKRIPGSTDTISGEKTPTTFSRGTVV